MNDIDFFNSFHFNEFSHTRRTHVDNSAGSFLHYVGYIKEGSGLLISASKRLAVTKGDLFYIPRGCRYHSYWANDGQTRLDSLGFQYFPLPEGVHYPLQKLHCDPEIWEMFALIRWLGTRGQEKMQSFTFPDGSAAGPDA